MLHVYDEQHNQMPVTIADLTLLSHAGVYCTGGARDDTLMKMVTRTLQSTMLYHPRRKQVAKSDSIKVGAM